MSPHSLETRYFFAACLSSMLPMERLIRGAFCGDDSILYFPKGTDFPDIQQGANLLWNFEAKLFRKRYGYFCGRYIIHHDRGCIVYYDPLKLISKLCAKHIKNREHLEEFRTSLCDVSQSRYNVRTIHIWTTLSVRLLRPHLLVRLFIEH